MVFKNRPSLKWQLSDRIIIYSHSSDGSVVDWSSDTVKTNWTRININHKYILTSSKGSSWRNQVTPRLPRWKNRLAPMTLPLTKTTLLPRMMKTYPIMSSTRVWRSLLCPRQRKKASWMTLPFRLQATRSSMHAQRPLQESNIRIPRGPPASGNLRHRNHRRRHRKQW